MHRFLLVRAKAGVCQAVLAAIRSITLSDVVREDLTRAFTKVKEEAKGQTLDLNDMGDAARTSMSTIKELSQSPNVAKNPTLKAKLVTLHASLKAYSARLTNLQTEARALHSDTDQLLSLLWEGTPNAPTAASDAAPPTEEEAAKEATSAEKEDLGIEVPPAAQRLEEINKHEPKSSSTAESASDSSAAAPKAEGEIEVDAVEVESPVENMSVTEITKELHEKNIEFSDCLDARSLRKRYTDYKEGRVSPRVHEQPPPPKKASQWTMSGKGSAESTKQQPQSSAQTPYNERQANTSETAVAPDPYPNAQRKMVDPMKYIYELKAELAAEHKLSPNQLDLWCGGICLEDNRRLYEYPQANHNRIEIRQKGDVPR